MGAYIQKTINLGLFKIHITKKGIGFSFGFKGCNVGKSASGKKYVSGGKGIFRYRKTKGRRR